MNYKTINPFWITGFVDGEGYIQYKTKPYKRIRMEVCNTDDTHEGMCIFGAGTSVSPDLNLAIEKAKMIAKSEIADMIKGTMNKQSKQFISEIGKDKEKHVITEVESALVNSIQDTPVRGYEIFKQDVTITKDGNYRAYVGLRLPMGELNKMYNWDAMSSNESSNL